MADVNIILKGKDLATNIFKKVKTGLTGINAATIGLVAGMGALGVGLKKVIDASSDLEETTNKFNVTFRDVIDNAQKVAEELQKSYGMSQRESKDLLSATGDLLTGFGFTQKAALDLSEQVQKLSVDLASFTNVEGGAQFASQALTKALLGEREQVKSLGIAILEADVKAKMFEQSQKGLRFESERQAKAHATLAIAIEQSKNAIGDYERSQGSFANQLRDTMADLEDFAAALGDLLLPALTKMLSVTQKVVKELTKLFDTSQTKAQVESMKQLVSETANLGKNADVIKEWNAVADKLTEALLKAGHASAELAKQNKEVVETSKQEIEIAKELGITLEELGKLSHEQIVERLNNKLEALQEETAAEEEAAEKEIESRQRVAEWNAEQLEAEKEHEEAVMQYLNVLRDQRVEREKAAQQKIRQEQAITRDMMIDFAGIAADGIGRSFAVGLKAMFTSNKNMLENMRELWKTVVNEIINAIGRAIARAIVLQALTAVLPGGKVLGATGFGKGLAAAFAINVATMQTPIGGRKTVPGSSQDLVPLIAHGGENLGRATGEGLTINFNSAVFNADETATAIFDIVRNHQFKTGEALTL